MQLTRVFLAALGVMICACSDRQPHSATVSYIDSLMNASFKSNVPGAVILVAKDGVPIFRKAYGLANVELDVPNKPENVFPIASMTKQFTTVCILQLAQQGKLTLQDDIRKYLPEFNTHGRLITVEHLLTHTSGIPNSEFKPEYIQRSALEQSQEEMFAFVMNDQPLFEPGSECSYNDFGFYLAGVIVERISGMRYGEYLQKNIFQPCGMKSSTTGSREKTIPLFATGYRAISDTTFMPAQYFNWKWDMGLGDILTCVDDMLKWDEALYTDKLVKRDLLEKAWTSFVLKDGTKTNYGYGWATVNFQELQMISHPGGIPGYASYALRIPSQHIFVVVLTNNNGRYGAAVSTAQQVALRLVGKELTKPAVRSLSAEQLNEYAGVYEKRHSAMSVLSNSTSDKVYRYVTFKDTILFSQWGGGTRSALFNVGKDLFGNRGMNSFVRFLRDPRGKITSLEGYTDPFVWGPIRAEKRTDLPLPKEQIPISLDEKILKSYTGKYIFALDVSKRIRLDGKRLYADDVGEIFPETPTRFFSKTSGVKIEFTRNAKGTVTTSFWTWIGRLEAKKVE